MSVDMAIWRMTDSGPERLPFAALQFEERLETLIAEDPSLVGLDVLIVGRQVPTAFAGYVDLLGIDSEGRLHVVELKRDRTPRDVVAQVLDYGSWAQNLTLDDLEEIYAERHDGTLAEAYADRFDQPLPSVVNADHQLTIIAGELDAASDRIVSYLAEGFGVPVNAVFFRHFVDEGRAYLARTWLLAPEEAGAAQGRTGRRSKAQPWNGRDFYVILGNVEQGADRWDLARRFNILTAGGGRWYWRPLRNLTPGKRVFAYVGGAGYVGVGTVAGELVTARDAVVQVNGRSESLLSQPDLPAAFEERARSDDDEVTEFVVPVHWQELRPIDKAVMERGLFASQVTACKLRDERTIAVLEEAFALGGGN